MKKQFFLLSLLLVSFNSFLTIKADSCGSSCDTSCNTGCDTSCSNSCNPTHGHTFRADRAAWTDASPERVSLFNTAVVKNLEKNDKHGLFQVAVFGGKATKVSEAAAYYLPYGHTSLTFDGSVTPQTFASVAAESTVTGTATATTGQTAGTVGNVSNQQLAVGGYVTGTGNGVTLATPFGSTTFAVDPATYKFDPNQDTSKILPWNFGITYAALFEPRGASASGSLVGTGLVTNPTFKSVINPCLYRWNVGAGFELRYQFSENVHGWYGKISTAVQTVRSKINLNEVVETEKTALTEANFPGASIDPYGGATLYANEPIVPGSNGTLFQMMANSAFATEAPVGSIAAAYLGYDEGSAGAGYRTTGFPIDQDGATNIAPNNVTEAFAQSAWNYGKIGCCSKITRLSDIELSIGHLWVCGDCAWSSWEFGLIIPTGNKPTAEWVAPAVVGNGQHAGLRIGSITSLLLTENDDSSTWYRLDMDARYLFRNTQNRSFDLMGNEWSRYMMVWQSEDDYSAALNAMMATFSSTESLTARRNYTPGINVFTTDFYVKPQFQARLNSAVVYTGDRFQAEIGWNTFVRQQECVELACDWGVTPAFADSSYLGGVGLNANRTIYNDSQTTVANAIDSSLRGYTLANQPLVNVAQQAASGTTQFTIAIPASTADANIANAAALYSDFAIGEDMINFDSASTPAVITQTPYLTLGCAFDYECIPTLAVGASYEFTSSNRALNQWTVWGKFECAF